MELSFGACFIVFSCGFYLGLFGFLLGSLVRKLVCVVGRSMWWPPARGGLEASVACCSVKRCAELCLPCMFHFTGTIGVKDVMYRKERGGERRGWIQIEKLHRVDTSTGTR